MKKCSHGDYQKIVTFPVFSNYTVYIVFTDSISESKFKRYGNRDETDNAHGLHVSTKSGDSHLLYKIEDAPTGILAHEAWHAIFRMFEWAGVELDNESVAYHLGYLVQRVSDFKNKLIDNGIGVKSSSEKVKHGKRRTKGHRARGHSRKATTVTRNR